MPILLLGLAFLLGGAKTPMAFCAWTLPALVFSGIPFWNRTRLGHKTISFLSMVAGILLAQIYSLDPTASLFWSLEYLVLACLWLSLQRMPADKDPDFFWNGMAVLGFLSALLTSVQWVRHQIPYGALPLNPNFNAVWMAAIAAALTARTRKTRMEVLLIVWLSAIVLFGHSRSGLLALMGGMSFSLAERYPVRRIAGVLALLLIAAMLIPHGWLLIHRLHVFENGGRLHLWQLACRAMADYPLTGYGPGNFEMAYQRHAFPTQGAVRFGQTTAFAHNDFLQAAVELGWPLAALLAGGYLTLLLRPLPKNRPLARPAKSILIALGIAACVNPIFKMPILAYLAILAASCMTSSDRVPYPEKIPAQEKILLLIPVSVLLLASWCGLRTLWADQRQWMRIISVNPRDAEAWHELAYASSDSSQIIAAHERAVEESPAQVYYVEALARALESSPAPDTIPRALEVYLKAIQLAPSRAPNVLGVARLLWRAGEFHEALPWAQRAHDLEPNYWESELWMARCLEQTGDKHGARVILDNTAKRHDEFARTSFLPPQFPYEQTILAYDASVIKSERSRMGR